VSVFLSSVILVFIILVFFPSSAIFVCSFRIFLYTVYIFLKSAPRVANTLAQGSPAHGS